MIEIFDRSRRRVAIAENAYAVRETARINSVGQLTFSLPDGDEKCAYCNPFWYVRQNGGELHRILPETQTVDEVGGVVYQCEHVLATLIDRFLIGSHIVGNLGVYTADVIRYILARQSDWVLYECDFRRQFEYGWEQESLLSALFSVANPLSEPFMWVTDTTVYPWRLSLKRLQTAGKPDLYIRYRHNMTSYQRSSDPQPLVTRLYPLGYGEGVNQLGIAEVNGGVPYLQSPPDIVAKYGIIERPWIDRRYEDAASLKAAAEAMLAALQEPLVAYRIGFHELSAEDLAGAQVGKRVRIVKPGTGEFTDTYITEVSRDFEDVTNTTITVANRETSIASSLADMADRQRIEQSYAQGATQLYSQSLQANCDSQTGAVLDFFIPREMRIINKVLVKIRVDRFRAYSKSTETAESQVVTSTTTDNETRTSSSGGGTSTTTSSGGGDSATSDSGGGETTDTETEASSVEWNENMRTGTTEDHSHSYRAVRSHRHRVRIPSHRHDFRISSHSHEVRISSHSHEITIRGHNHRTTIPAHGHSITPGIYRFGSAKSAAVYIGGTKKHTFSGRSAELDITGWLLGSDRKIPRGSWLSLEVRPDDLAYISINLIVQGFVQSRGDNTV